MATPPGLEPGTCRLEGGCSIQLSYGAVASWWRRRAARRKSVRPGNAPAIGEIVRIGHGAPGRLFRLDHLVGDAVALRIGDRLLLGREAQLDLALHVARGGPAHQRLDRARLFGLVFEH